MPKFTTVKCWYVPQAVTDPEAVKQSPPSFNIVKKSILKNGYRGYAIEEREFVESQEWYKPFLLGDEVRFYLDGSGVYKLANCDLTENELYFERLSVPIGYQPWIFYSWQSDYNSSRSKIRTALTDAVEHINANLAPRKEIEIVEATRPEDGSNDIVQALKSNIDRCMFAVFDITNVSQVIDNKPPADQEPEETAKCYTNANVVFEVSYALSQKTPEQVLLLKHNRSKDLSSDETPFDFTHNKRLDFDKPAKLKKDIQDIVIGYLRRHNFIKGD